MDSAKSELLQQKEEEMASLRARIEQLNEELKTATAEKIQSAQYGLVLLDEKEEIQKRYEELENKYEAKKQDFEDLTEALTKLQTIQRVSATSGIEQEEQLLQESAKKEETFVNTLLELEREIKQLKNERDNVKDDRDKYQQENAKLLEKKEYQERERRKILAELKDLKQREARIHLEINELEEENISLQKQVSSLKSSQVDFETFKLEIERLQGEIEILQTQNEECTKLKSIAEKQTKEALEALQSEREQKYAIKKELDKKLNSETYLNINNFVGFAGLKFDNDLTCDDSENFDDAVMDDNGALKKLENEFLASDSFVTQPPSLEGSLFSEVHMNEIKKFERLLEEADSQKHQLTQRLNDTQSLLDKAQADLKSQSVKIEKIFDEITNLNLDDTVDDVKDPELSNIRQLVKSKLSNIDLSGYKNELTTLRGSIEEYAKKTKCYEEDHGTLSTMLSEFYTHYNQTFEELSLVSEELASLYHHLCLINGVTPDRVILNHTQPTYDSIVKIDQLKEKLHHINTQLKEIKSVECNNLLDTVKDQLKVLRTAIDTAIENKPDRQQHLHVEPQMTSIFSLTYWHRGPAN